MQRAIRESVGGKQNIVPIRYPSSGLFEQIGQNFVSIPSSDFGRLYQCQIQGCPAGNINYGRSEEPIRLLLQYYGVKILFARIARAVGRVVYGPYNPQA
jgi:hypothetical protein